LRIFFFAAALLFSLYTHAQSVQIIGQVKDTVDKKPLVKASVVLISKKDSTLKAFVRTDEQGRFQLEMPTGSVFSLLVSYPKYADWFDDLQLPNSGSKDLGIISLNTKAYLLKEIVIRNTSPIRMKGDTTEYIADSFKVTPNADVQELLRKMPGIQVNAKGEITAQGEKVKKVYVDGEEFFSDDPAMVTKNLRADAISQVQVYDKKSDQAAFTGIDDGQREKTINLKLKESAKNGYFAKIEAGSTLARYNLGKAMGNLFKGKRKIAAYATTNSSEFEGLNWDELATYGDGGNITTEFNDDGSSMMFMSSGDGDYAENKGLPDQQTIGGFYGNKWKNYSIGNSAQFQKVRMNIQNNGYTKSILPGYSLDNTYAEDKLQTRKRYKMGSKNEWGTDSTGLFKLNLNAAQTSRNSNSTYTSETFNNNNSISSLLNKSSQERSNADKDNQLTGSLSYRQKLKKKGRSISAEAAWNLDDKTSEGSLYSSTRYGLSSSLDIVDQKKSGRQQSSYTNSSMIFTEPISKKSFLVFKYNLAIGKNESERNTKSKSGQGNYDQLVDSLSNHFQFNTFSNSGSLNFRYVDKKLTMSAGSGLGRVNYQANDLEKLTNRSISFANFLPVFNLVFKPKQQRRLSIDYNGSTTNPSLGQIQPLINNDNPLSIQVGNANLVQGFRNNMRFQFSDYKVLKSRSLNLNGGFSTTSNDIAMSTAVDAAGKTISKYINVNGVYDYDIRASYSRDIIKGISGGLVLRQDGGSNINLVNGIRNVTNYHSRSISLDFGYWGERWYSFNGSFRIGKSSSTSTLRADFKNTYTTMSGYLAADLKFKKIKSYVNLWSDLTYYGSNDVFVKPLSMFVFTPTFSKNFGKTESFTAKLKVFDLFNQNRDINRNNSSNFLSQSTYNTLRRFVMFGFVYNLKNKSALATPAK
jgi:hypothetical protein